MKKLLPIICIPLLLLSMTGCKLAGDDVSAIVIVYLVTAILSLLLLVTYCASVKKKEVWFLLLFVSVFIVNLGYFCLSVSKNLPEALLANRISYLGSVFLPMAMLMIILKMSKLRYKKWLPGVLLGVCIAVFLLAATPGYLNIYYSEVSIENVNGVSVLNKIYGPWHAVYPIFLALFFLTIISVVIVSFAKKKISSVLHSVFLAVAVFINIGVWGFEQFIDINFEFLSVSYVISEAFFLCLELMAQEGEKQKEESVTVPSAAKAEAVTEEPVKKEEPPRFSEEAIQCFEEGVRKLTYTENVIYGLYINGKSTKDVIAELNIKENTVKYHNKNIYSKLGVSSRKQLVEMATYIRKK